jgi:integrase
MPKQGNSSGKCGVERRIPLWPETVAAIEEWLSIRPEPKEKADSKLLFVTYLGQKWVKMSPSGAPSDSLGQEFSRLLRKLGLKRKGLSFYALRHTFETIAGESLDQVAVNIVMGHADNSMASHYRERVNDDRLLAVCERVRAWLFSETST